MPVIAKAYTSPTLVLLAFDWPLGNGRDDFLGFSIERTPGFFGQATSFLPNRIDFNGPAPDGQDYSSQDAPIQKFYWWDARIDTPNRGTTFSYRLVPVIGPWDGVQPLDAEATTIDVYIPLVEDHGITTQFNRAVVSSQSFAHRFPDLQTGAQIKAARAWLGNGMEQAVPEFLTRGGGKDMEGAIYHLTDGTWIIPSLSHYGGSVSLAYNHTSTDDRSDAAIATLVTSGQPDTNFAQRTHANIMHNKFLVRVGPGDDPEAVLTGSANFTSEGLSAQANVLHAFESPALAALYLARKRYLDGNPALAATKHAQTGWSAPVAVGDATIRVFFPPEEDANRVSIDTVVAAMNGAQHSVLMCAFDPTDKTLLDTLFQVADAGKMVLALVNRIPSQPPGGDPAHADVAAAIAIFNRARADHDITGFGAFKKNEAPTGFAPERVLWPGENPKIMVRVHHKFVVIDAEGDNPIVYTGSANLSGNSLHHNDENMLEITNCPRLAQMYFAEFLRLYEHYRAREVHTSPTPTPGGTIKLTKDNAWSKKYFVDGSPEMKARIAMSGGVPV